MMLIQPRRSFILLALFTAIHCLAFFILFNETLHRFIHLILIAAVLTNFIYTLRRHVFFVDRRSVQRCWRDKDGSWCIEFRNGFVGSANLLKNSFTSRYLILLNFKIAGRFLPISLPLAYDSVSKEVLRQLRILSNESIL